MTLRLPDDLMDWIGKQASNNHRTQNQQIQHLLEQAKKLDDKPRYILNRAGLCHNGTHNFRDSMPGTGEFCNCGMYVLGELR
jgi:hypothetical protein